jgi:DNA-binding transcriptional ArsR family regulator
VTDKTNLVLHPVRLRILSELAGKQLSTRQLAQALPDISQASLYRHIGLLVDNQIMEVVSERVVNGATERTYAITQAGIRLTPDDLHGLSPQEHVRLFTTYAGTLIESFAEGLKDRNPDDALRDGLSYNRVTIHLSDEEVIQFRAELMAVIERAWSNQPAPDRKPYTLASVVIPGKSKG